MSGGQGSVFPFFCVLCPGPHLVCPGRQEMMDHDHTKYSLFSRRHKCFCSEGQGKGHEREGRPLHVHIFIERVSIFYLGTMYTGSCLSNPTSLYLPPRTPILPLSQLPSLFLIVKTPSQVTAAHESDGVAIPRNMINLLLAMTPKESSF